AVFAIPSEHSSGTAQLRATMLPGLGSALDREQYATIAPHPNGMQAAARLAEELGSGEPSRPVFTPGGIKAPLRGNPGLNILQVAVSDGKDVTHQHAVAVPFYLTTEGSTTQPIEVEKIVYNPRGRDLEEGEQVILRSISASPLDLTGWIIRDLARHTFQFPDGFILQPGATVTIYSRAGLNDSANLYWGRTQPVWNNRGDALVLRDAQGNIVAHYAY
ncbi:MAG: lamin tail domain-containing protein, partial [Methylobacter sp.]